MNNVGKLSFQIEVKRILQILSNDIYDSPYALLRENIQNAYDAILMRKQDDKTSFDPKIEVNIESHLITIKDNGIGMNEDVVSNNFWMAGSSGKNNELAQKAGVVGTFGIGAMANFGVCKTLKVITHYLKGNQTIETFAKRESLSVSEKCIDYIIKDEEREPGTEVIAELDDSINLTLEGAIQYLNPYLMYLNIPVYINGTNISQKQYMDIFDVKNENLFATESYDIDQNNFKFKLALNYTKQNQVKIHCTDIYKDFQKIDGEIVLTQGGGSIYGLRNYFGLASIPVSGYFNLGGIVNLSSLHPTAGREALSRESIEFVAQLMNILELKIAESISNLEIAEFNTAFQSYINSYGRIDLAKKIKIEIKPDDERWRLEDINPIINDKKVFFYSGRDPQTILSFGNENSYLLLISQDNPRRKIQLSYVRNKGIEEVPDRARIIKVIDRKDLLIAEAGLILRITNILSDDYLISDTKIYIAEISHRVPSIVEYNDGTLKIYLSRESNAVQQVLQMYNAAYEVFGGFVKDFIRNHLYQKFADYVPSSTRQGADALHKILQRKRELYKYDFSDMGQLDALMNDYVTGKIAFPEVLEKSSTIVKTQRQSVQQNQVGAVEQEIPSIIGNNEVEKDSFDEYAAVPPIVREETKTDKKILKTDKPYERLNNFLLFLSLSDKVFKYQREFFLEPHTTKIIWGMHRVVYIFTHASNRLSFYYDIELKEKLPENVTGGKSIPTTTIITEDKIFIPIINELNNSFDIKEGTKEFYVKYDIIADFNIQ